LFKRNEKVQITNKKSLYLAEGAPSASAAASGTRHRRREAVALQQQNRGRPSELWWWCWPRLWRRRRGLVVVAERMWREVVGVVEVIVVVVESVMAWTSASTDADCRRRLWLEESKEKLLSN
jgi:hypothetical protein